MNILRLFKNLKWIDYLFIVIVCGLIVLQVWLDLELPSYTENIMLELAKLQEGLEAEMSVILVNGGYMLACAFGSLASAICVGFCTANLSSRLAYNLRGKIYNKIQGFSLAEINKFSTASLITRTTNDVTQVQVFLALGTQAIIKAPILAIWSVLEILSKGWQWSTALAVAIGFLILMVAIIVIVAIIALVMIKKEEN